MIEKMKSLNITGPKDDVDRMMDAYLPRYEIYLEDTLSELKAVEGLRPYIETNPYKEELLKAEELTESYHELLPEHTDRRLKLGDAVQLIRSPGRGLKELTDEKSVLINQKNELQAFKDKAVPFAGLNYSAKRIPGFRFIKFRSGRASREHHEEFSTYVYGTTDMVMFKCEEDGDYMWMVYFTPEKLADEVDAICASIRSERSFLPDEYEGTPVEASHVLNGRASVSQGQIDEADQAIVESTSNHKDGLVTVYHVTQIFSTNFDVRKMAAVIRHDLHNSYILYERMAQKDAADFQKEIECDSDTFCTMKDDHNNIMSESPTKIKNPGPFKPFEAYVEMYGLPSYDEPDPIVLIGIAYSTLFGFMFGDAGQGLYLLTGGFLLYRFKKVRLAGIISCCGVFSTVFGPLLGSVSGFEDIIDAVWLRPQETMANLPSTGKLDTIFVVAVAIGMGITLMCVVLNIINDARVHDMKKIHFDTNGAAGFIFYPALSYVIIPYMTGSTLSTTAIPVVMLLIPLLIMFLKEPLTVVVEKESERIKGGMDTFIAQRIFELFEALLNYFSNTLSFVRAGVFTVSHAAMMQVVLMFAVAEAGESANWAVVIGGNLLVCGMEDLIVDIQVLRLKYYELFGRPYRGGGRAFESYGRIAGEW